MRLVIVSDTHNVPSVHDIKMPEGDVLIHAGDLTIEGKDYEIDNVGKWLAGLPYKKKFIIAGNHDFLFQQNRQKAIAHLGHGRNGVWYLEDTAIKFGGKVFYGSPWQPWFYDWAFNLKRGPELKAKWDMLFEGIDVLITHGPPKGILDKTNPYRGQPGDNVGCQDLMDAVMRIKPELHIFGHIHCQYGFKHFNGVNFINASICDEAYRPTREPFIWDI